MNVWTVTDISESPFRAQIWFNTNPPGTPIDSELVTSSNTAIRPLPRPKVKLQLASNVTGDPSGGIKAFVRGQPELLLDGGKKKLLINVLTKRLLYKKSQ